MLGSRRETVPRKHLETLRGLGKTDLSLTSMTARWENQVGDNYISLERALMPGVSEQSCDAFIELQWKFHGGYMALRKYTTVSIHRETYEAGKRFMEKHGYPSWEALIRGTISGHRVQRDGVIEIDLVPLVRKQAESNQGTKKAESPRPSVDVKQNPRASRKRPPLDQGTIVCDSCREKYLVFWNPADPTDVDEARKMLASASWTCDRCALRILQQRMRHPPRNLHLTDKKPGPGRESRVMILVDRTKRFRVKAT